MQTYAYAELRTYNICVYVQKGYTACTYGKVRTQF